MRLRSESLRRYPQTRLSARQHLVSTSYLPPEEKCLTATQSPEERIDRAIEELNDSVASELIDLIHKSSPSFFAQLVIDLLDDRIRRSLRLPDRARTFRGRRSIPGGVPGQEERPVRRPTTYA